MEPIATKPKGVFRARNLFLVLLLILATLYFRSSVVSTYALFMEKKSLPHYLHAVKITQSQFDAITSDVSTIENGLIVKEPISKALIGAGLIPKDLFVIEKVLIFDRYKDAYYLHSRLKFNDYQVSTFKITKAQEIPAPYIFTYSNRWKPEGGCFSCGCSCYMDRDLAISNDRIYVNTYGRDDAIRPENQGIYFLMKPGATALKVTPKIDGIFKITNGGCKLSYTIDSQAYTLDTCAL